MEIILMLSKQIVGTCLLASVFVVHVLSEYVVFTAREATHAAPQRVQAVMLEQDVLLHDEVGVCPVLAVVDVAMECQMT